MNTNLMSIFVVILICTTLFTTLAYQLTEINNKNTILTDEDRTMLLDLNSNINSSLPLSNIEAESEDDNITSGGEQDDFSREFRESKATVSNQKTTIESVFNIPSLFIKSAGIPLNDQVNFYLKVIGSLFGFMIIIAVYIAWKTGEVKNR